MSLHTLSAASIAAKIKAGELSALDATKAALARFDAHNPALNAATAILHDRAIARAQELDVRRAAGEDLGPLDGVPFAAKNLWDIQGITTLAGSIIERSKPPATADGFAVAALERAGAICVAALNMDEYAYGFTTENSHYGATRNPHDLSRSAGGSSGGSGAAVAAGLVSITLGTDTNGSIRVPASNNGIWGLKPTYGRLSRAGSIMFVPSLDHVGPLTRTVTDLALSYEALQGQDPADPAQSFRGLQPVSHLASKGLAGLRIARLGGHFAEASHPEPQHAADQVAHALGATTTVTLPLAAAGRAAAFLITASEGANQHLPDLRTREQDFEPLTRDRLIAGAMLPAQWLIHAQRVRSLYREQARDLFQHWDILIAPATPAPAMPLGQASIELGGKTVPLRASFGQYTQPISAIGLPVIAAPIQNAAGHMPLAIQLIAAPWAEDKLFQAAFALEQSGLCAAPIAPAFA